MYLKLDYFRFIRYTWRGYGQIILPEMPRRVHTEILQTSPHWWGILRYRIPSHAFHGSSRVQTKATSQPICSKVCPYNSKFCTIFQMFCPLWLFKVSSWFYLCMTAFIIGSVLNLNCYQLCRTYVLQYIHYISQCHTIYSLVLQDHQTLSSNKQLICNQSCYLN